jgi:hypothetical protein
MNKNTKLVIALIIVVILVTSALVVDAKVCFPYKRLSMYDLSTWRPTGNHLEAFRPFKVSGVVVDNHAKLSVVAVVEAQFVTLRAGGRNLTSKACFPKGFGF